jgi:hypothetical protein
MMSAGVDAKQLAIQHVGEPRERMPIGLLERRKCPAEIDQAKAGINVEVSDNILAVVEAEELVVYDSGSIQQQSSEHEQCAQERSLTRSSHLSHAGRRS